MLRNSRLSMTSQRRGGIMAEARDPANDELHGINANEGDVRQPLPQKADRDVNPEGFDALMSEFSKVCVFGSQEVVAIVKVTRPPGVKTVTMAFRVYEGVHAERNFINWWNERYPDGNNADETPTEIITYINRSPCLRCAKELRPWLNEERNNVRLTIHFLWDYYDHRNDDELTESEYIEEVVRALGNRDDNGPDRPIQRGDLQIGDIDEATLEQRLGTDGFLLLGIPSNARWNEFAEILGGLYRAD